MKDVLISSEDVKKIFDGLFEKCKAATDISDLTKSHILNYLFEGLYQVNELEAAEVQKKLNATFDRLLFREGESDAEIH